MYGRTGYMIITNNEMRYFIEIIWRESVEHGWARSEGMKFCIAQETTGIAYTLHVVSADFFLKLMGLTRRF